MSFVIGSLVFVGGCVASLVYLGANLNGVICCILALLLGSKIAAK